MSRFSLLASRSLAFLILFVFFFACEDTLVDGSSVEMENNLLECLYKDCGSGTNELVQEQVFTTKSEVPLLGMQRAFYDKFTVAEHLNNFEMDGFPAWDQLFTVEVNAAFRHYLVPVYKSSSDDVEAVISFIHYLGHGVARIDYLDREDIISYPSSYNDQLFSKKDNGLGGKWYTLEGISSIFLSLDDSLFGYYGTDMLNLLSAEARQDMLAKDCKIKINYVQETTWFTYNGGTLVSIEVTYTFSSSTTISDGVGCGGSTPSGGSGNSGPGGGGSSGGPIIGGPSGPGVILITTDPNDPNNRCIEDGVGCDDDDDDDEEEEEEEELFQTDSIRIDNELVVQLPCVDALLNDFFNSSNDLNSFIQGAFNNPNAPQVNLYFTHGYVGTNHGVTIPVLGGGGGGNLYALSLEIKFNSAHPGNNMINRCSQDAVYATIIHEIFHANLLYYRVRDGFISFVNPYNGQLFLTTTGSEDDQHELMAAVVVPVMEQMLIDFNPSLAAIQGNTGHSAAYFLAWGGLEDTPQFNNYMTGELFTAYEDVNNAANCLAASGTIAAYNFINCQ